MTAAQETSSVTPSLTRRRRTFLAPLWMAAWAGILLLAAAIIYWNSATTTTIVLLRHAEQQLGSVSDAPLSQQGELRASRLAQMFGDAQAFGRVQRIYVTDTHRTRQTAADLAQQLHLEPVVVDASGDTAALARRILRENNGGMALVVGHANNIPQLVERLSAFSQVPAMGDEEFDTIYIVTVPTIGRASVLRMKY
jgi:2,3-bisphosphoglycerate-dependent phosphoglycerate mutase